MREVDPLRRLAPPVEPLSPEAVARVRARALARRRRRLPVARVLAPVAAAAAVALVVVLGGRPDREIPAPAPSAAAAGAPRLLLDGWAVARVDEWAPGHGELTLRRDGRELRIGWSPADEPFGVAGKLDAPAAAHAEVAGARAPVWAAGGRGEYIAEWRDGALSLVASGPAPSAAAFAARIGALQQVGDAAWRAALPARAITPDDQQAAVEKMVGAIPLPPGVDLARIGDATTTRDRYQLVATVAGTIACGWIAAWVDGDEATRARAEAVLADARDWPLLHSIDAEGDYPEVLWQYADAVNGSGTVVGGKTLTVEESYEAALCP